MTIDLHQPVFEILDRLGLTPEDVARLEITPTAATADVFHLHDGRKYIDPDTGRPAVRERRYEITTINPALEVDVQGLPE